MPLLDDAVQRPPASAQAVDPPAHVGVFHQGRRVVRLRPRIDQQRAPATPVLVLDEFTHAGDIGRGV